MREIPLSTCEKSFVENAVKDGKRVDGRDHTSYRPIKILFGTEWGCCEVSMGKTRAMAQVSCSVEVPKASRNNEGMLIVNVELSPMAAAHFEAGRPSKQGINVNRLVERCIKESRCIDLESLCIVVEEKAWQLRVDVHILNHDGNLVDVATIAALAALCHFRRPDVTLDGREVRIHSSEERDPVPLTILHHPVAVTFAFFHNGKHFVMDPTSLEESSAQGTLTMGFNTYRELCTLQTVGDALCVSKETVLSCANLAANKATQIVQLIKNALLEDLESRSSRNTMGLADGVAVERSRITTMAQAESAFSLVQEVDIVETEEAEEPVTVDKKITRDQDIVTLDDESSSENEVEMVQLVAASEKITKPPEIVLGDDSEEETTVVLSDL